MAAAALAACKPEAYTGPLDSPVGNWDGVYTDYYFNGEMVGEAEDCQYSAISFYKDGLCCIEGVKGAFPYNYDQAFDLLTIDNTTWSVCTLTGAEMVLQYIETIYPDPADVTEVQNEYKGKTIYADTNGHYYIGNDQERVYCFTYVTYDEAGTPVVEFWYDSHIDHFIPLVVEVKK